MATVKLWFDPACYWSWRAARWLLDTAGQRDVTVEWRPFSLKVLYGTDMNPDWADMLDTSHRALRIVAALRQAGRGDDLTRFYLALGTAAHEDGQPMTEDTVRDAAKSAGVDDVFDAFHDPGLDEPVRKDTETAIASAGPDIGSPVIELPGAARGIQGPVLKQVPPAAEAGELYDAISRLAAAPYFYEITRGRV